MLPRFLALLTILGLTATLDADQPAKKRTPREALLEFSTLIGDWRCTGQPIGSVEDKQKNFWTERMSWGWQFKDKDAWLTIGFEKGRNFSAGEVRYVPEKDHYTLSVTTVKKEKISYVGTIEVRDKTKIVTFERDGDKQTERLVFSLLHSNRIIYRYEVRPDGKELFAKKWSVGATKEGESFAVGDGRPECVVSGGTATTPVSYMGKTYYVCCSGCRDEFNASPAKYVKEYEEKLKAKKK
ncbi:MAG: YHS domain-containing protein [Planctomycetes bacterium]|nr:YHS domain-containing protein [Planctomycetota bacterium]